MKNTKNNAVIAIIIVLTGLLIITFFKNIIAEKKPDQQVNIDEFAKCLAGKNIIMYGNWWCGACQKQKELFGNAFKNIKYVECSKNPQECLSKNIEYTPTWILPNGERIIGLISLETLSEKSGCPLK